MQKFVKICLVILILHSTVGIPIDIPGMPDHSDFTTPEKVKFDGYPIEIIKVTTRDNYINTIHRIPSKVQGSPAVILQHGLLASSSQWVMNIPSKNLAYILHDAGMDIYMSNFRGNRYSREHVYLNPNDTANTGGFHGYWNFSFHEMGIYDLPTVIDTVISTSGQNDVYYIGHSMGTTAYFVLCSEMPSYRDKIKYAILASPVAYTALIRSPIRLLARLIIGGITTAVLEELGPGELAPNGNILQEMTTFTCKNITSLLCSNLFFLQFGFDFPQLNETMVVIYNSQIPAGSSTKSILHFAQGVNVPIFRQFDYGILENRRVYGTSFPPIYNLKNVNAPMAFIWGDNDWPADPEDVARLTRDLTPNYRDRPEDFQSFRVDWHLWNHADYLTAIDVIELAYDTTLELLRNN